MGVFSQSYNYDIILFRCGERGIYPRQAQVYTFWKNSLDRALVIPRKLHPIYKNIAIKATFLYMAESEGFTIRYYLYLLKEAHMHQGDSHSVLVCPSRTSVLTTITFRIKKYPNGYFPMRRARDSNPRDHKGHGFQDRCD